MIHTDRSSHPHIILASSSPYRRELLQRFGVAFTVVSPAIDESTRPGESSTDLVLRLTEDKARAVANSHKKGIIIASDQIASCEGNVLGKPHTRENACQQLLHQSGKSVSFLTGIAVLNAEDGTLQLDHVTCTVHFRKLSKTQILNYLDLEQPYDCAGSFKSEKLGIALLTMMDCPDPTALIGLPLIRLASMLANADVDVLTPHCTPNL